MKDQMDRSLNDIDSYLSLINSMLPDLYKIAKARLDNNDDIDDAIEETIIKSYKNLNRLKHKEFFKTWLIKILINECNLIYRANKRQFNILNRIKKNNNYKKYNVTTLSEVDDKLELQKILEELNHNERTVIVLHYNNGYSIKEIANILNENVNTIKSRLLRGKNKIKNMKKGDINNDEHRK